MTHDSDKCAVFLQYDLGESPVKRRGFCYDFWRTHEGSSSGMDNGIGKFYFSSGYHGRSRFCGSVWPKAARIKTIW